MHVCCKCIETCGVLSLSARRARGTVTGCARDRLIDGLHAVAARQDARKRNRRRQVAKRHGQAHIVADLPWVQGPQPQRRASGLDSADPPPRTLARYPSALVQTQPLSLQPGEHRSGRAHHPHAVPDLCGSTLRVPSWWCHSLPRPRGYQVCGLIRSATRSQSSDKWCCRLLAPTPHQTPRRAHHNRQ